MIWYVYLLECEPDTLYTGITTDVARRLRQHVSGGRTAAKYTRSHPPRALAALWSVPDEHTARSLEWHIKRLTRAEKRALAVAPERLSERFGAIVPDARAEDVGAYLEVFRL